MQLWHVVQRVSVHRVKSHSAESGYVYQYSFQESRRAKRGLFSSGTEYVFEVSSDRKSNFSLIIFLKDDAPKAWAKKKGRELSSAEQYAAAKLGLLRAFDRAESPAALPREVLVDGASIEELLARLDL